MHRSTRVVLLLLALTLGLGWLGVHHSTPQAALAAPTPTATAAPVDALPAAAPQIPATAATANLPRTELPLAADPPAPIATRPAPVLVRGQLLRDGLPVRGCDLSFHAAGADGRQQEVEWDFTDRNGCFDVELPAARYVVRSEDAAPWTIAFLVPEDRRELVLTFHLPP